MKKILLIILILSLISCVSNKRIHKFDKDRIPYKTGHCNIK